MSDDQETGNEQGTGSGGSDGAEAAGAKDGGAKDGGTGEARGGTAGGAQGGGRMGDGIRQGIGVLSAFKDALEETIQEARERGDLSSDRAKEVMKDTLAKAQTAAEGAREKLDFANQAEMEAVRSAIDAVRERVGALEESVFGATNDPGSGESEAPESGGDDAGTKPAGEA
jgi:polyhydroxyalkanoate synthesis regulator phasin